MNKKKLLITLLVGVMSLVLVNAALVGYLSNKVTAEIEVESPMIMSISEGKESWGVDEFPEGQASSSEWKEDITISDIHGGETITLYTLSENLAKVNITGFENAIVTNPLGVTCDDFESVVVRVDSIYGDLGYGKPQELISGGCNVIDGYHVWFGSGENSLWGPGEADVSEIVVTFKTDAVGTYTFTSQVIPAK